MCFCSLRDPRTVVSFYNGTFSRNEALSVLRGPFPGDVIVGVRVVLTFARVQDIFHWPLDVASRITTGVGIFREGTRLFERENLSHRRHVLSAGCPFERLYAHGRWRGAAQCQTNCDVTIRFLSGEHWNMLALNTPIV